MSGAPDGCLHRLAACTDSMWLTSTRQRGEGWLARSMNRRSIQGRHVRSLGRGRDDYGWCPRDGPVVPARRSVPLLDPHRIALTATSERPTRTVRESQHESSALMLPEDANN